MQEFIRRTRSLIVRRSDSPRFQVRLYKCLPSVNIFRIDDELFWGPYLIREQSRNTPTFIVRKGGILFDTLAKHFNTIWSDPELSRPVPAGWLEG